VRLNAKPDDIVIDFDGIAREMGYGRDRPASSLEPVLEVRNDRLAALSREPRDRVAWVILTAPSKALRAWWRGQLNVAAEDLTVIVPPRGVLRSRIFQDPDRPGLKLKLHQMEIVDRWFRREAANDPGVFRSGCGVSGDPSDPLHPWNEVEGDDEH